MHVPDDEAPEAPGEGAPDRARRALLAGLGALAAAGASGSLLAQRTPAPLYDPARFSNLSKALTGYLVRDAATSNALVSALQEAVGTDALKRIATLAAVIPPAQLGSELRVAKLEREAEIVIVALYTGVVDTPKGPQVVTYDGALIWQALPWTKPNMACGGLTNYWSEPPKP